MSSIRVSGNTSGHYDLTVPDVAGSNTIALDKIVVADSNGNVGIGTTGPNESLHIYRASGDASFKLQNASQTLRIDQNSIRTTTNTPLAMFTNNTSTQGFRIENDGRMIIGQTAGQTNVKLTVAGNVKMGSAATSSWANTINDIGGLDIIVGSGSTGLTVWDDNSQSTPRFKVTRAGNVEINSGQLKLANLTSDPSSPVTGGVYFNTTSNLAYVYNGSAWDQISNVPFGATGGIETTYSSGGFNYKVHTFTSSGTFTPLGTGTVDVLVVAGGGGGGTCNTSEQGGGGGGAGGFITSSGTSGGNTSAISSINVQPQGYTVTVGSGGSGGAFAEDQPGSQGGNSSVFGITAIGGGGGGGNSTEGQSGGSGGGGKESSGVGRSGTAGQGFSGGAGSEGDDRGGGGGGAGQAGQNYNSGSRSAGGNGLANSIRTGSAVNYAGGGGGGGTRLGVAIGGAGGGGGAGVAGATNTGGGGGSDTGSVSATKGQNGGSGIVVIRYQV